MLLVSLSLSSFSWFLVWMWTWPYRQRKPKSRREWQRERLARVGAYCDFPHKEYTRDPKAARSRRVVALAAHPLRNDRPLLCLGLRRRDPAQRDAQGELVVLRLPRDRSTFRGQASFPHSK